MTGNRILVVGGSTRSAAIAAALIAAGADVVRADVAGGDLGCAEQQLERFYVETGPLIDARGPFSVADAPCYSYGPPVKGRGGKVRRW